eukprot:4881779-Prorocentrum_lima.AAC.1
MAAMAVAVLALQRMARSDQQDVAAVPSGSTPAWKASSWLTAATWCLALPGHPPPESMTDIVWQYCDPL